MGFLKKHPIIISFILIFFAVQLFPLIYKSKREADPVSRVIMRINHYPYSAINSVRLSIKNTWSNYVGLRGKNEENKKLKEENTKLRAELFSLQEIKLQNKRLKKLLEFIDDGPYETVSSNIIGGSPSLLRSEFLVIDKGENYGIEVGMPVATQKGVVGRVYLVNKTSSQVMLITDPISAVDAIVQRTRARGIVKGNGKGCTLEYLDSRSNISKGDKVLTSGKDGFYPKGILIGKVEKVEPEGGLFKAKIIPEAPINSLEEVLVIKKLKKSAGKK